MAAIFTKRHYEEVARLLRRYKNSAPDNRLYLAAMVADFAQMFMADNPKFRRDLFVPKITGGGGLPPP